MVMCIVSGGAEILMSWLFGKRLDRIKHNDEHNIVILWKGVHWNENWTGSQHNPNSNFP
jgi:hypothetical protein